MKLCFISNFRSPHDSLRYVWGGRQPQVPKTSVNLGGNVREKFMCLPSILILTQESREWGDKSFGHLCCWLIHHKTQPIHNIQNLQMAPKLAVIYQVEGTIKFNIQREDLEQEQSCPESFHSAGPWDEGFDWRRLCSCPSKFQ